MKDYQQILELIETVPLNDQSGINEIDARVVLYLSGKRPSLKNNIIFYFGLDNKERCAFDQRGYEFQSQIFRSYSRSRDALKSIRPSNWHFEIQNRRIAGFVGVAFINRILLTDLTVESPLLPTEERAELHTIIQAIAFERGWK